MADGQAQLDVAFDLARVERAARAEGKIYGCYVALHEPRKG